MKPVKPTILLDVDGVIADLVGGVRAILRDCGYYRSDSDFWTYDFATVLSAPEMRIIDAYCHRTGFCSEIDWYHGGITFVAMLKAIGTVHAVTKPWQCPTWHQERVDWLRPVLKPEDVYFCHRKELVHGDVLIEDSSDNLRRWMARHPDGLGVLIDRPWNASDAQDLETLPTFYRAKSLTFAVTHISAYLRKYRESDTLVCG